MQNKALFYSDLRKNIKVLFFVLLNPVAYVSYVRDFLHNS